MSSWSGNRRAEVVGGPAAEREILVPGVATFRVSGGCRVTIDRVAGADPVEVEASLAGPGVRRFVAAAPYVAAAPGGGRGRKAGRWASSVRRAAGKSSLACALADRGHTLLTDDLGAVTCLAGGSPALHPGPPVVRIWGRSARQLGWPTDDGHRIKEGVDKFAYERPDRFADRSRRLDAVYVLVKDAGDDVQFVRVDGLREVRDLLLGGDVHPRVPRRRLRPGRGTSPRSAGSPTRSRRSSCATRPAGLRWASSRSRWSGTLRRCCGRA